MITVTMILYVKFLHTNTHVHIQGVSGRCHWADNGEVTGQELEGGLERVKRFSGGTALWLIGYGPMGVEGGMVRWHHTVLREGKREGAAEKENGEGQRVIKRNSGRWQHHLYEVNSSLSSHTLVKLRITLHLFLDIVYFSVEKVHYSR